MKRLPAWLFLFLSGSAVCQLAIGAEAKTLAEARRLNDEGHYEQGETLARELLKEAETKHGADSIQVADVLDVLVKSLDWGGKDARPETRQLAERTIAIREKLDGLDHPDLAVSLTGLGHVFVDQGDLAGARRLYERALAIREKAFGAEDPQVAKSLHNLGSLSAQMGDYPSARPLFERALAIREKMQPADPLQVAETLDNLGNLLRIMGEYAAARPIYDRVLAIREKAQGSDHPDLGTTVGNFAILLAQTGDTQGAKAQFERALEIRTKSLGPDHPEVGWGMHNLGTVLYSQGDLAGAKARFEEARRVLEKSLGPDHPQMTEVLTGLATVDLDIGDTDQARVLFERAVSISEKAFGPEHPILADPLNALGVLLKRTGDLAGSKAKYERALAIWEKTVGTGHPFYASALMNLADGQWFLGDFDKALGNALRSERLLREHFQATARGLSEQEALRYESARVSGLDVALSVLGAKPAVASPSDASQRVWDAIIRSRALVLDEMASRHRAIPKEGSQPIDALMRRFEVARTALAELVVRGPDPENLEVYKSQLETARSEREQAERVLAAASATFRNDLTRASSGLAEVSAVLPVGSALIAFARYAQLVKPPDRKAVPSYVAFVLRAGEKRPAMVPLGPAEGIETLVNAWRAQAAADPRSSPDAARAETLYREAGERLREAIWDPLAKTVKDRSFLFVVPEGALNLVSLDALPVGKDRYLAETGPVVHYLSSERDLLPRPGSSRHSGEGLLVLGGPDFDARTVPGDSVRSAMNPAGGNPKVASYRGERAGCGDFRSLRFDPLPSARLEADEVESIWSSPGARAWTGRGEVLKLTGTEADEETFKRQAPGRKVLHLATHGFFVQDRCESTLDGARSSGGPKGGESPAAATSDNPLLLTGLALGGANRREELARDADVEDGILTAEEIAALDLSAAEWVVLTACGSGVGRIQVGEGVLGLRRAFEISGAGTLIMSLWSLDDEATRQWVRELYRERLGGRTTAQAVRGAGLAWIRSQRGSGRSTHPFFWGGFVAAGEWK